MTRWTEADIEREADDARDREIGDEVSRAGQQDAEAAYADLLAKIRERAKWFRESARRDRQAVDWPWKQGRAAAYSHAAETLEMLAMTHHLDMNAQRRPEAKA